MLANPELIAELDRVTQVAKLIHQIEQKGRESETASPEELKRISLQIKTYREQIRQLDKV